MWTRHWTAEEAISFVQKRKQINYHHFRAGVDADKFRSADNTPKLRLHTPVTGICAM